jgi:hypothetical protein
VLRNNSTRMHYLINTLTRTRIINNNTVSRATIRREVQPALRPGVSRDILVVAAVVVVVVGRNMV